MEVIDNNKLNYSCSCGSIMLGDIIEWVVWCSNKHCEHYEIKYKIPQSVLIELEKA